MKIEQLIVQYLYNNKKVTLQDIGVFYLSPNVTIPGETEKDAVLPDGAITFEYNTKAVQDEQLINFIVEQTRKIKPLATSDLESFTILGRQFMNIGKPLPIEGLGILQKNQSGEYEFIQGHSISPKLEPVPALLKEKSKEEIVFTTPSRQPDNKAGIIAAVILFLIIAASAAFYFVYQNNKKNKTEQSLIIADSIPSRKDTVASVVAPVSDSITPINDGNTFKVVIREYNTPEGAHAGYMKFTANGRKLLEYTTDSVKYKLAVPFTRPLADSAIVRDSLQRLFGGDPYLEKAQ